MGNRFICKLEKSYVCVASIVEQATVIELR